MGTLMEDLRGRVTEMRDKTKTRIAEWKERGWRGSRSSKRQRVFPIVDEVKRKGLVSAIKARREARLQKSRGQLGRGPEEIEPAFPKDMLVKKELEIRPTVGKREIAIEL